MSMRITNSMMIRRTMYDQNTNLNSVNKYLHQLTSLKKIHKPSDDPVGTSRILKFESEITDTVSFKESATAAYSFMDKTEGSLREISDVLKKLKELAVQGATGTLTAEDKQKVSNEIDQMKSHLVQVANDTYMGLHIFSGFTSDKPLVNSDGSYNLKEVNMGTMEAQDVDYKLGVSQNITVNVTGQDVFGTQRGEVKGGAITLPLTAGAINLPIVVTDNLGVPKTITATITATATPQYPANMFELTRDLNKSLKTVIDGDPTLEPYQGRLGIVADGNTLKVVAEGLGMDNLKSVGVNTSADLGFPANVTSDIQQGNPKPIFKMMDQLKNRLNEGDSEGVSKLIKDIDDNITNILQVRGQVGAKMNNMETMEARMEDIKLNVTSLLSLVQDTDMAEAQMKLSTYESVYKSSLAVSARLIQPTLIDFLR